MLEGMFDNSTFYAPEASEQASIPGNQPPPDAGTTEAAAITATTDTITDTSDLAGAGANTTEGVKQGEAVDGNGVTIPTPENVPYARFQEVIAERQAAQAKIDALQAQMDALTPTLELLKQNGVDPATVPDRYREQVQQREAQEWETAKDTIVSEATSRVQEDVANDISSRMLAEGYTIAPNGKGGMTFGEDGDAEYFARFNERMESGIVQGLIKSLSGAEIATQEAQRQSAQIAQSQFGSTLQQAVEAAKIEAVDYNPDILNFVLSQPGATPDSVKALMANTHAHANAVATARTAELTAKVTELETQLANAVEAGKQAALKEMKPGFTNPAALAPGAPVPAAGEQYKARGAFSEAWGLEALAAA